MLIEFKAKNFKSIREEIHLNLLVEENDINKEHPENLIPFKQEKNMYLLKSAVFAGPNASGKSNILEVLYFISHLVTNSHAYEGPIAFPFFEFRKDNKNHPGEFEITFVQNRIIYRYGFWIKSGKIIKEYLKKSDYLTKTTPIAKLTFSNVFTKELDTTKNSNLEDIILDATGDNRLYLSVAGTTFKNKKVREAFEWFKEQTHFLSPDIKLLNNNQIQNFTFYKYFKDTNEKYLDKVKRLISSIDVGISDIAVKKYSKEELLENLPKDLPEELKEELLETDFPKVRTKHTIKSNHYYLSFGEESNGTKTFTGLAGMIVDAIDKNLALIIDEFDNSLHPELSRELLKFFHSKSKNAQLLFSTHDISLLDLEIFRKDQIFFAEKDFDEQYTKIYSLAEIKGIRDSDNIQKKYMNNRFGAFPFIQLEK